MNVLVAWSVAATLVLAGKPEVAALTDSPAGSLGAKPGQKPSPPLVPPCTSPLSPVSDLPRTAGETIRYVVDVNGLSVGTIDFKIERQGLFDGHAVTEYRSLFKLDGLVSTFVPVEGQAAALVPEASYTPARAMNRYKLSDTHFEENQTFGAQGRSVKSKRTRNGKPADDSRQFSTPATDFVSGFYLIRRVPKDVAGCAIVYGNQRTYTIWIKPDGKERVKTPVGLREADRYLVTYASDKAKKALNGVIWMGDGPERLPYKVQLDGQNQLEARIHLYETGK